MPATLAAEVNIVCLSPRERGDGSWSGANPPHAVRISARGQGVVPGKGVGILLHEGGREDVEETSGDDPHDEDAVVVSGFSRPVDTLTVASHASSILASHEAALT